MILRASILFLIISCSFFKEEDSGSSTGTADLDKIADEEQISTFPGALSIINNEDLMDKYKALCSSSQSSKPDDLFKKAVGCFYSNELRKSYYIFKSILNEFSSNGPMKSNVLNNMGTIQAKWGHLDLALTLFNESIQLSRNVVNAFNFLQVQINSGGFDSQNSLIPFLDNASESGRPLSYLKAKVAYLDNRASSSLNYFDQSVKSPTEIINYLYILLKLERIDKFKEVSSKFQDELEGNADFEVLNAEVASKSQSNNEETNE